MNLIEFVRACLNNPPAVLLLSPLTLSPSQVSLLSSPETQLVPAPRTEEKRGPSPKSALLTHTRQGITSQYTSLLTQFIGR